MMNNNNHQNPNCSFAAEIVPYIYDEIGAKEKFAFEAHLANCATCPEELADFMDIRFSVNDWKQNEFAPLATPVIEIPFEKVKVREIAAVETSWWSNLRRIFTLSPSFFTASAAMAALLVCVGLVFVIFKYSGNVDVAEVGNEAKKKASVSPTKEILSNKANDKTAVSDANSNLSGKTPAPSIKVNPQPKEAAVVKVAERKPKNVTENLPGKTTNPTINHSNHPNIRKNPPSNERQLPRLNNFDEDEDDSLRLAELFDDIETME